MILLDRQFLRDENLCGSVCTEPGMRFAAIVADGMGGNDGGELASDIAAQEFDTWLTDLPTGLDCDNVRFLANRFASDTHNLVNSKGAELPGFLGMGTTLCGVFLYEDSWYWVNVGDSRLYLRRNGIMRQISRDHSYRNLYNDPSQPSNLIYNAIGGGEQYQCFADCRPIYLEPGDNLLICSDGLSDMLTSDQIEQAWPLGAKALVDEAKAAGGLDNISVIILNILSNGPNV